MATTFSTYADTLGSRAIIPTLTTIPEYLEEYFEIYSDVDFYYSNVKYSDYIMRFSSIDKTDRVIKALLSRNSYKYTKQFELLGLEYNPIENYDRYEEGDVTDTRTLKGGTIESETVTPNLTTTTNPNTTTTTTPNLTDTTDAHSIQNTHGVYPYDDDATLHQESKDIQDNPTVSTHSTGTETVTQTGSNTTTQSGTTQTSRSSSADNIDKNVRKLNTHIHGNIGVTTAGQMIAEQRKVALYSFYDVLFADIILDICLYTFDEDNITSSGGDTPVPTPTTTDAYSVKYNNSTVGLALDTLSLRIDEVGLVSFNRIESLDSKIDSEVETLDSKIDSEVESLNTSIGVMDEKLLIDEADIFTLKAQTNDLLRLLFVNPGDEVTIADYWGGGGVTSGTTSIYFNVPFSKIPIDCKPRVKSCTISIRSTSGQYPINSATITGGVMTDYNINTFYVDGSIRFELKKKSGTVPSISNNTPLCVNLNSCVFEFIES